jgi:hypothetical protein
VAHATGPAHVPAPVATASPESRRAAPRLEQAVAAIDRNWQWALAALMLVDAALLLYMGRGLTFFYDDWNFVTEDYGGGIHSLLLAHVGNISIFPIAIYKVLFHLVGLNHYAVFRIVVIALHLTCGALVYTLAARRLPRAPSLLAAALILFLGAAWEDLLWAFQVGYLLSVAGGLAAWALLERKGRWMEVAAMLCLVVSAGSSSLGIAVMIGVAVEFVWARRWRSVWIVVIPAFLYALWYLGYGESQITANSLFNAPGFAEDLAAAAFGGLIGRALEWGRPLALVGLLLVLRSLARPLAATPRLAGLLATGVGLWAVTAVARSTISQPEASRYVYLGAVVIVLAGVELLRGIEITPRVTALATLLVGFCAITGLTVMHAGAMGLRTTSKTVTADLGALEIAAAYVPPSYQPDPQGAPQILAGPYLHTVRAIGSTPADTPAEIISAEPAVRTEVDEDLIKLEGGGALAPASPVTSVSSNYPLVANVGGSQPVHSGRCWKTTAIGPGTYTEFVLPAAGLLVRATSQPVQVVVRRFSPPLGGVVLGAVEPRRSEVVKFPVDASGRPWFVRLASGGASEVCGVA